MRLLKKTNKKIIRFLLLVWVALLPLVLWSGAVLAQGKNEQQLSKPLIILFALSILALVPILLIMMTSFIKITVVLALVRNALGTQQIPPNQVITGLAIILTIYIMSPVGMDVYRNSRGLIDQTSTEGFFSQASVSIVMDGLKKGEEPIRAFVMKYASEKDRSLFYNLAKKMRKPEDRDQVKDNDFLILVPAFVVSELARAFQIGFIIFLPFLVIDMVVANVLLSLGMFQLSPVTVSLPFKLLLFVLVDGWYLIAKGLVLGYT